MVAGCIRGLQLLAHRLVALEHAQAALHVAHHHAGLGSAAAGILGLRAGLDGEAHAVLAMGIGADDLGGEQGLAGIAGMQRDDGVHRGVGAPGTCLGRVDARRGEEFAEAGVHLGGDGLREVGDCVHVGTALVVGERAGCGC
jgi:hypothetical protein